VFSQQTVVDEIKVSSQLGNYINAVQKKTTNISEGIQSTNDKFLKKLLRFEQKLNQRTRKRKVLNGKASDAEGGLVLGALIENISTDVKRPEFARGYLSHLDTITTTIKYFASQPGQVLQNLSITMAGLDNAKAGISSLNQKLQQAENIQNRIKAELNNIQKKFADAGMIKQFNTVSKEFYYYNERIRNLKSSIEQSGGIEKEVVGYLRNTKPFQNFMKQHSELAMLFPSNLPNGNQPNLTGLQTRSEIQNLISKSSGKSDIDANQLFENRIAEANQLLAEIKSRTNKLGINRSDDLLNAIPKVNTQKTKSFWNRMEYGINIQSVKANGFWPVTNDIGVSLGYKLNQRSTIGVGGSHKLGLGKDFRNIKISHQGFSLRSFIDWKIKGNFYLSGAAELNYRSEFENFRVLFNQLAPGKTAVNNWSESAMIGVSKRYSIGRNWKGNVQILYNFLYKQKLPQSQPVLFRTGYYF